MGIPPSLTIFFAFSPFVERLRRVARAVSSEREEESLAAPPPSLSLSLALSSPIARSRSVPLSSTPNREAIPPSRMSFPSPPSSNVRFPTTAAASSATSTSSDRKPAISEGRIPSRRRAARQLSSVDDAVREQRAPRHCLRRLSFVDAAQTASGGSTPSSTAFSRYSLNLTTARTTPAACAAARSKPSAEPEMVAAVSIVSAARSMPMRGEKPSSCTKS
mmetsp:Transcript_6961/g.17706  ORF Transcript_6961/g.17706 Transcript_6961/m.17706 type:complete len:219 (+) Transcript_6961:3660-4316(+)